jgi:hypothetical protein
MAEIENGKGSERAEGGEGKGRRREKEQELGRRRPGGRPVAREPTLEGR